MTLRVMIALAIFVIPVQVHAADYFVEAHTCNGSFVHTQISPDPISFRDTFWDCMDAESWVEASARAGRGILRARALAGDGHAGEYSYSGAMGEALAGMSFWDIIVQGPGTTTEVSLRLNLHAFLDPESNGGSSQAGIILDVSIHTNYLSGIAALDAGSDPMDPIADGLLEGLLVVGAGGGTIDGVVVTPPVTVPVNSTLGITINIRAYATAYDPYLAVSSVSNAGNTLSFPSTGPVFVVPAGYTVNSVEAGIIDNQWTPEVSSGEDSWGRWKSRY